MKNEKSETDILKGITPEQLALIKKQLKEELEAKEKEKTDISAVRPHCKMTICEDPKTGQIKVVYGKGCPGGYIERVAGTIATKGLAFEEASEEEDKEEKEKELKR